MVVGKSKHKTFRKEEKDGEVQRLKQALKRKDKEIEKLKSEMRTYEAAFQKNITFLKGKTKDIDLQDLLNGAKKDLNLKQIEDTKEETYQEFKQKWKCFSCNLGIMKITIISRQDGKFYFRRCTEPKCGHRTELKQFTEDVEIS